MNIKERIEEKIKNGLFEDVLELLDEYEQINPKDMDLLMYKIVYNIYINNLEEAKKLVKQGIRQYPTVGDMHFNYAYILELEGCLLESYEEYVKASFLYDMFEKEKIEETRIEEIKSNLAGNISDFIEACIKENKAEELKRIKRTLDRDETYFGLYDTIYNSMQNVIGKERWLSDSEKRFIALKSPYNCDNIVEPKLNMYESQAELLEVSQGKMFEYNDYEDALLPITSCVNDVNLKFESMSEDIQLVQNRKNQFYYYKISKGTTVTSDHICYFGNPIKLGHSKNRKKLVLNIFVDGLSQIVLNSQFKEIMPNLYKYFSDGMICKRAYSTGEWTYPSLASYVSGLQIPQHMCFHPNIDTTLPEDISLLAEYFQKEGYYTAKIDGEWRSTPRYGHTRGYDRYIYQNQGYGSKTRTLVGDIIDHIEMFKDTDQFIWTCFGDLHDVADGIDMPVVVQSRLSNNNRIETHNGTTSVKQRYDTNKIIKYKEYMKYIDIYLNILFSYINQNYDTDEVVISLFADHGQGYLVPDNEFFVSSERTNVAFMFKSGNRSFVSDELISICDYPAIICKLCNINYKKSYSDANLPIVFGGKEEREYVISESIHPGDEYRATLYYKDYTVYFEANDVVDNFGRVCLDNHTITLKNKKGEVINNRLLCEKARQIIYNRMAPLTRYNLNKKSV